MFHCITSHVIWHASFEIHSLKKGNNIVSYSEKDAWGKSGSEPLTEMILIK